LYLEQLMASSSIREHCINTQKRVSSRLILDICTSHTKGWSESAVDEYE